MTNTIAVADTYSEAFDLSTPVDLEHALELLAEAPSPRIYLPNCQFRETMDLRAHHTVRLLFPFIGYEYQNRAGGIQSAAHGMHSLDRRRFEMRPVVFHSPRFGYFHSESDR